jgi:hypothetical protein
MKLVWEANRRRWEDDFMDKSKLKRERKVAQWVLVEPKDAWRDRLEGLIFEESVRTQ